MDLSQDEAIDALVASVPPSRCCVHTQVTTGALERVSLVQACG